MANFDFLKGSLQYAMFAHAAIEAERVYGSSPAMCAVGCRKALELSVKWVYAADDELVMPYNDNLQSLIRDVGFRDAVGPDVWRSLPYIIKLGNRAVHTDEVILKDEAMSCLWGLFDFIQWIDYCYGEDYAERRFSEKQVPTEKVAVDTKRIQEAESLLTAKAAELEKLKRQVAELSAKYTAEKEKHKEERRYEPPDLPEWKTRKLYIDEDMKEMGWHFTGPDANVAVEYAVDGMGEAGERGYCDYVLFGKDGLPLAVVEAKRTAKDPQSGRKQVMLYADALERKFGRRPMMYTTNGFETYFWDDQAGPQRMVSGISSQDDLQKVMNRRGQVADLLTLPIDDAITDRYYQKAAIRAVCEEVQRGVRKHLLVMATGTGKTRTAASLTDVLSRGKVVTNVLFLADRTALVKQAKDDFKNYLPHMSLCNLCTNKEDRGARIVFSTYPTMMNAIDEARTKDGTRLFTPAHFDLIIIDESHRSIFKKYRAIFEYFDAILVGLTATPKLDVNHNTYDFFGLEHGVPTYAYDYETAVYQDHVLVPYYNYEVKTKFLSEGISYEDLSDADKERYEDDFIEDGVLPEFIPSAQMNQFIFNGPTVDAVLEDLMERGIRVCGGDRIGKTIIFAQNKRHAEFILHRFNVLYPECKGLFAQRVVCDDSYAQSVIDDFKQPEKPPYIAVSVDMMDTGIDVPECVNLVFFKRVRSKAKFWQMIGRGTRLCKDLTCLDQIDGEYTGKKRFLIFDYCGNFEYFREHQEGFSATESKTLSENIFGKQVRLISLLQEAIYGDEVCQAWRDELVKTCVSEIAALNRELVSVKLKLRYVEKYKEAAAFASLGEGDKKELLQQVAPIIRLWDTDELAKRFDNFMYGMMLSYAEGLPTFKSARNRLCTLAKDLEKKANIPQVKEKLSFIREVSTDDFWAKGDVRSFEKARVELRELIKFLDTGKSRAPIITRLTDPTLEAHEGLTMEPFSDFEDYKKKVNRYIGEHGNTMAIHKLTHNIPLTKGDYQELERILTSELGSREDYIREYGDTPFGLLVRQIGKLDHEAAMQAFSRFINDESLNQRQIEFLHKIIRHIEQNGYMEKGELLRAPFDKPFSFMKLFGGQLGSDIMDVISEIKDNATHIAG